MRPMYLVQADYSWGSWCSGITFASHAEGPGLKSQCVHWRVRSAAVAAVGYRERCCIHASCCLTTLSVAAASSGVLSLPTSQDCSGAAAYLPTGDATINMEQCVPRSSTPQCMCCAADDRSIAAPEKVLLMGLAVVRAHASYVSCPG